MRSRLLALTIILCILIGTNKMGNSTANTIWPITGIPADAKELIEKFFSTMDDSTSSAGDVLADEIFTIEGVLIAAAGTTKGSPGMRDQSQTHCAEMITLL